MPIEESNIETNEDSLSLSADAQHHIKSGYEATEKHSLLGERSSTTVHGMIPYDPARSQLQIYQVRGATKVIMHIKGGTKVFFKRNIQFVTQIELKPQQAAQISLPLQPIQNYQLSSVAIALHSCPLQLTCHFRNSQEQVFGLTTFKGQFGRRVPVSDGSSSGGGEMGTWAQINTPQGEGRGGAGEVGDGGGGGACGAAGGGGGRGGGGDDGKGDEQEEGDEGNEEEGEGEEEQEKEDEENNGAEEENEQCDSGLDGMSETPFRPAILCTGSTPPNMEQFVVPPHLVPQPSNPVVIPPLLPSPPPYPTLPSIQPFFAMCSSPPPPPPDLPSTPPLSDGSNSAISLDEGDNGILISGAQPVPSPAGSPHNVDPDLSQDSGPIPFLSLAEHHHDEPM